VSDRKEFSALRRILVALDASPQSLAALGSVVDLAAGARAELLGLFVEDVRLLDLGGLQAARALTYPAGLDRPLDTPSLERDMRTLATRARQALSAAAGRLGVSWTFRVARGEVASELLAASRDADLVTLGRASARFVGPSHLGSTARAILARAPGAVLLHGPAGGGDSVILVVDDPETSLHALALATEIVRAAAKSLLVLLAPKHAADTDRLRERIADRLRGLGLGAGFRQIEPDDDASLARLVASEGPIAIVLPATLGMLDETGLERLAREVACSLLVVR
jgi:nucleotide-binding universal stress UspA family protein